MGYELELRLDGETHVIDGDEIIDVQATREPSAISDWVVEIPKDTVAEEWTRADAFLWFDDELLFRGELLNVVTEDGSGTTSLEGPDIVKKLDRGGAAVRFESTLGHDAISEYLTEHTDWQHTVVEPNPEQVDEGLTVQDAPAVDNFTDLFEAEDTYPAEVTDSGIRALQSCYVSEWPGAASTYYERSDFTNGTGTRLNSDGETADWDIDGVEYSIPEDHAVLRWRADIPDGTHPSFTISVDGTEVLDASEDAFLGGMDWNRTNIPSQIDPGDHTVTFEATSTRDDSDTTDPSIYIDTVAIVDDRFEYSFDNEVHEDEGYLDGPELYPDAAQLVSTAAETSFNIEQGHLAVQANDSGAGFAIELSFDGGETWPPDDGEEKTTTISVPNDIPTTTVIGRATLSRYPIDENPQDETPRYGYQGQEITSWELQVDTNDLAAIEDSEYVGSHFENLQELCSDSGMVFVPEYAEDELQLTVMEPAAIERGLDVTVLDYNRELDLGDYANTLTVFGATDENGDRLEVTARSESEIDRVGEEVAATPQWRENVETSDQLRNIARVELSKLISEDSLSGSLEIVPKPITPGYSYSVPELDGESVTLWSTDFSDGSSPSGSLQFGEPEDMASIVAQMRSEIRRAKR